MVNKVIPICSGCTEYRKRDRWANDVCAHPRAQLPRDVIRGESLESYCVDVRGSMGVCGPLGKLFSAREPF